MRVILKGVEWDEARVAAKIEVSRVSLEAAILAVYARQTADERVVKHTKHVNGVGFNGPDSTFLSSLAEWLRQGRTLTERQARHARKRMIKYRRQVLEHIASKPGAEVIR